MRHRTISRRSLVRAASATGLALPFGGALAPRASRAQQGAAPKRLLVLELPNVIWQSEWIPRGGRDVLAGTGNASQFEFGPQSAMFAPIRDHVTILAGVQLERAIGDAHVGAQVQIMTGGVMGKVDRAIDPVKNAPAPTDIPQGSELSRFPSIDQLLARDSTLGAGQATRSVTWAANSEVSARQHVPVLSFDTSAQPKPIFPENSPQRAYNSLFNGFVPGGISAAERAEMEATTKRRRSLLDYTSQSVQRLSARVSTAERQRLEAHLQGLSELESRLTPAPENGNGFAEVTLPDPAQMGGLRLNDDRDYEQVLESFFSLAKAGFGFDRMRVATLMLATGHNAINYKTLIPELSVGGTAHGVTHRNYEDKNLDMRRIALWYTDRLGAFVKDLADTPDVDGSSMLDNTLIVFFSEVSITGNGLAAQHSYTDTPMALIGGKNIGNAGGRCLRYDRRRNTMDFWTSVGRQLGLADDFVQGEAEFSSGGLEELFS